MKAVLPAIARPLIEAGLSPDLTVGWFTTPEQACDLIADADIAWVDMQPHARTAEAVAAAGPGLRWLSTIYAGLDAFPLDRLAANGVVLTNGAGINAVAVAEYAVMGMLVAAKRYDEVVRLADAHRWTSTPPGQLELDGSAALIIGYGTIGRLIGDRLAAFGVQVTGVTRTGRDGSLSPEAWRGALSGYDWIILAAPSTAATRAMIGADEFAAMKPGAWLINMARGDMVDQPALIAALAAGRIGGAFLDTVTPEPLAPDDPLWSAPNALLTMHLSGRSQTRMYARAAALFLDNLDAFCTGRPMRNVVDLLAGY